MSDIEIPQDKPYSPPQRKKCCGCELETNFRQLLSCPAFLKLLEIVVSISILIMALVVFNYRKEEEGDNFAGKEAYIAFFIFLTLSLVSSIILMSCYIQVYQSKRSQTLKNYSKPMDLVSGLMMLTAFVIYMYLLSKWQLDRLNQKDKEGNLPYFIDMIIISVFTLIDSIFHLMIICY